MPGALMLWLDRAFAPSANGLEPAPTPPERAEVVVRPLGSRSKAASRAWISPEPERTDWTGLSGGPLRLQSDSAGSAFASAFALAFPARSQPAAQLDARPTERAYAGRRGPPFQAPAVTPSVASIAAPCPCRAWTRLPWDRIPTSRSPSMTGSLRTRC